MAKSRSQFTDEIFGICAEFSQNQLPTKLDVIKNILFYKIDNGEKFASNKEFIKRTAERVKTVWCKTGIPIVEDTSIERCLTKIYEKYMLLKKKKNYKCYESEVESLKTEMKSLFDICKCKCEKKCDCSYDSKVPKTEVQFLVDQRSERRMFLGTIDPNATRKAEALERRKQNNCTDSPISKRRDTKETVQPSRRPFTPLALSPIKTKYIPLTNVARECQRFGVSHVASASLLNAFMVDTKRASANNMIDRNQIQRNISKFNNECAKTHLDKIQKYVNESTCIGLFFDGKKDKTNNFELNEETLQKHPRIQTEEHYSIVLQPNNMYYCTVTPNGSKAIDIARAICDKIRTDNINVDKIRFIGGDGTPTNTGEHGGEFQNKCIHSQ